jgi:hypothetical protein
LTEGLVLLLRANLRELRQTRHGFMHWLEQRPERRV